MQLVWPRASRFFAFAFALSAFSLLLSALLSHDLVTSSLRTGDGQQVQVEVGVFQVYASQPISASASIPASCDVELQSAAASSSRVAFSFPFRPCSAFIAARALLLLALSLSGLCVLACYPLCLLPSSSTVASSLLLPAALLAPLATLCALTASLLLIAARVDTSWQWGGGFDSLCAGWGMALLDSAILAGTLWQEKRGGGEEADETRQEMVIKEALRVSERDWEED